MTDYIALAAPTLPRSLLDTIGAYGMARSDGVGPLEIQHRWENLIDGIKSYALAAAPSAQAQAQAAPEDVCRAELQNIGSAKRFDRKVFSCDAEFADWAQSRARAALSAAPIDPAQDREDARLLSQAKFLRQVAAEIRKAGHAGWGNTCDGAADAIDAALAARPEQSQDCETVDEELMRSVRVYAARPDRMNETAVRAQILIALQDAALSVAPSQDREDALRYRWIISELRAALGTLENIYYSSLNDEAANALIDEARQAPKEPTP